MISWILYQIKCLKYSVILMGFGIKMVFLEVIYHLGFKVDWNRFFTELEDYVLTVDEY